MQKFLQSNENMKNFVFSPIKTVIGFLLCWAMLWASSWQWSRYHEKVNLENSFEKLDDSKELLINNLEQIHSEDDINSNAVPDDQTLEINKLNNHKVKFKGTYLLGEQLVIMNMKDEYGPGMWLMAPLKLDNLNQIVFVSRGFIPYSDVNPDNWIKYNLEGSYELFGVLKKTVDKKNFLSPDSAAKTKNEYINRWYYPDMKKIALQLKKIYPDSYIEDRFYIQRLGKPENPELKYPKQSVSIDIPSSTHYWYTFEWIFLACITLILTAWSQFKRNNNLLSSLAIFFIFCIASSSSAETRVINSRTAKTNILAEKAGVDEKLGNEVNLDIEVTNQDGKRVKISDLLIADRPLLILPVYFSCPKLCTFIQTGIANNINSFSAELGKDYRVISFSIDPSESLELAKEKSQYYRSMVKNGGSGWEFVFADQATINKLMSQLGYKFMPDSEDFIHSATTILLNSKKQVSRYLYGMELPNSDFNFALIEAGEGKIGSSLSKALLYCFHYDYTQGKYTFAAMVFIRVVSIIVLLALAYLLYRISKKKSIY